MTLPVDTCRLRGLDLLRASAIVFVMLSHYAGFVSGAHTFGILDEIGSSGVDLFFVLSGYLIGNQILAPLARGEVQALRTSLHTFFARRLLRTLPNYYAVLALYLLFPHAPFGGASTPPLWQMLTFTQNIGLRYGQTFTHSWSLCIEEQFYVVLPLAVLLLARWRRSARLAWCALLGAIGCGVAARACAALLHGYDAFSAEVYYSTLCRFDGLLPGVAIAMLKNFHPVAFARLQRHPNALLGAGLAACAAALACLHGALPNALFATTFGFSLVAASFALLTLAALGPTCLLNRIRVPGAAQLALWSYAVYLMHKPVFMMLAPQLKRLHVDPEAPLTIVVVMALGVLAGWLLFVGVESPFMRLRARWYPARTEARAARAAAVVAAAPVGDGVALR